ncbi:hypothetical protein ABZ916_37050 [Streptomyces sp. NPDC046853]|uniref:hypothetical protein n=1 Tax=Streptomyces sp. NPDC046853 TaxID=3154920 RepID=UPI0034103257
MGSLFKELQAREAAAGERVDGFEEQLGEVAGRLEEAREDLERLRICGADVVFQQLAVVPVGALAEVPGGRDRAAAKVHVNDHVFPQHVWFDDHVFPQVAST